MKVQLKNVRASFVNVHRKSAVGDGEPDYNMAALFPPGHPAEKIMNDAIDAAAKEKWADKAPGILKQLRAAGKVALKDGNTKSYDGYADQLFVSTRRSRRPKVVDKDGRTELTEEDGKPYSGCIVNLSLMIWAQDNAFGKRVNAEIKGVQFVRDGDPFGGGGAPIGDDEFESVVDEGDDADLV